MARVFVREAKLQDVEELANMALKLVKTHSKYDKLLYGLSSTAKEEYIKYFRKNIHGSKQTLVLAETGCKIVGYALAGIEPRAPIYRLNKRCVVHDIFVVKGFRGKGLSRALFQKLLEFSKKKKIRLMQVIVDERNEKAIQIYKRFGFKDYDKTMSLKL